MTAIDAKYAKLGGSSGLLGTPVGPERTAARGGRVRDYASGSIYWHDSLIFDDLDPASGAAEIHGPIRDKWRETGGDAGPLGYPITDVSRTAYGAGRRSDFERGSIYWHPNVGAHEVHGAIRDLWFRLGGPLEHVIALRAANGRYVVAEGGGGGPLNANRPVRREWESFALLPLAGRPLVSGGVVRLRTFGGTFVMAEGGGGGAVGARGLIPDRWEALIATKILGSGRRGPAGSRLQAGDHVAFQTASGHWLSAEGSGASAIVARREDPGAEETFVLEFVDEWRSSVLGYPTTDETAAGRDGARRSEFERGAVCWRGDIGAHEVHGAILRTWEAHGGLGLPRTNETAARDQRGRFNLFERGAVYWSPPTGAHWLQGPVLERWTDAGAERSAFGYPTGEPTTVSGGGGSTFAFEFGSIGYRRSSRVMSFLGQNMALVVAPVPYKGAVPREQNLERLIDYLRTKPYAVVGLSECFADDERARIRRALDEIFPHRLSGPEAASPLSDGGLMLLSKQPFLSTSSTIFPVPVGETEDAWAEKGILHACLADSVERPLCDVFVTHLQNPAAGGSESKRNIVKRQLLHAGSYIRATRNPRVPAFLIGDLNTTAANTGLYEDMQARLGFWQDAWVAAGRRRVSGAVGPLLHDSLVPDADDLPGVTSDDAGSFEPEKRSRLATDRARHRRGQRIDYALGWKGEVRWLPMHQADVVMLQALAGRDSSDHYGIAVSFSTSIDFELHAERRVAAVRVALVQIHCIRETFGAGSDELRVRLELRSASGDRQVLRTREIGDLDDHEVHPILPAPALEIGDPGNTLEVHVSADEIESALLPDQHVGSQVLRFDRQRLLGQIGATRFHQAYLRDAGEYAIGLEVTVTPA